MAEIEAHRINLPQPNSSDLIYQVRTGKVELEGQPATLTLGKYDGSDYADAQVDDYHLDYVMRWRPPVQMTVRARFSHPEPALLGTAGFGFWNDPFGMTKIPQRTSWRTYWILPQAVWFFFASPPSNMEFAQGVSGYGWKMATLDSSGWLAKALLPFAPLAMLLCRWRKGYEMLWPIAQRVLKIGEKSVPTAMDEWHTYDLEWRVEGVRFCIDDREVFRSKYSPRGPLGFVAWVDNQYMVATPQGHFRSGLVATEKQWLEIESLDVRRLAD
jgi:hypothetical protein